MFRPFPKWPSSGWSTISEELYTYYNTIISVSEYKKGVGGWTRSRLQKAGRVCDTILFITNIVVLLTAVPSIVGLL